MEQKGKLIEKIYLIDRLDWRNWLQENFRKKQEVWLIYPHKSSGKTRIGYNDAVEEALCFGWIDSTIRSHDAESSIQRFTPRRAGSSFSHANKERLRWLMGQNLIHPSQLESVREVVREEYVLPKDILDAIQEDTEASQFFQTLPEGYKRIRIGYIDSARPRPEEFAKRLSNFIEKTRKGKIIPGHGGIDKYYGFKNR